MPSDSLKDFMLIAIPMMSAILPLTIGVEVCKLSAQISWQHFAGWGLVWSGVLIFHHTRNVMQKRLDALIARAEKEE